jgi:threonine/homoserine/homoserine lactone efflux protein
MSIVLILAVPVALVLVLTLLQVIHFILFLPALLQLVGFAYTLWFIYRYLLSAENRDKLLQQGKQLLKETGIS